MFHHETSDHKFLLMTSCFASTLTLVANSECLAPDAGTQAFEDSVSVADGGVDKAQAIMKVLIQYQEGANGAPAFVVNSGWDKFQCPGQAEPVYTCVVQKVSFLPELSARRDELLQGMQEGNRYVWASVNILGGLDIANNSAEVSDKELVLLDFFEAEVCGDGVDNDINGDVDINDQQCAYLPEYSQTYEYCDPTQVRYHQTTESSVTVTEPGEILWARWTVEHNDENRPDAVEIGLYHNNQLVAESSLLDFVDVLEVPPNPPPAEHQARIASLNAAIAAIEGGHVPRVQDFDISDAVRGLAADGVWTMKVNSDDGITRRKGQIVKWKLEITRKP